MVLDVVQQSHEFGFCKQNLGYFVPGGTHCSLQNWNRLILLIFVIFYDFFKIFTLNFDFYFTFQAILKQIEEVLLEKDLLGLMKTIKNLGDVIKYIFSTKNFITF